MLEELKLKLLSVDNQDNTENILLIILDFLDKNGFPFFRPKSLIPVLWTNSIYDKLLKQYVDTLSSPAMIELRLIYTQLVLINRNKNDFWTSVYDGSLDQNGCNLFTRIISNVYSKFITKNRSLLESLELLDNESISKLEHILVRDEIPILLKFLSVYTGKKDKIRFLSQRLLITSRTLLSNPDDLQPKSDADKYETIDVLVGEIPHIHSELFLKIKLRQLDNELYLKELDLANSQKREPKYNPLSWRYRVEIMNKKQNGSQGNIK